MQPMIRSYPIGLFLRTRKPLFDCLIRSSFSLEFQKEADLVVWGTGAGGGGRRAGVGCPVIPSTMI